MKTLTIFLFVLCSAFSGYGQQQAFGSISLNNTDDREIIKFTIPHEVNVRQYRVEASNDSVQFDVIATFAAKDYTPFSSSYSYDLTLYGYKYYRIGMICMNGRMPYSSIVAEKQEINHPLQEMQSKPVTLTSTTLAKK